MNNFVAILVATRYAEKKAYVLDTQNNRVAPIADFQSAFRLAQHLNSGKADAENCGWMAISDLAYL